MPTNRASADEAQSLSLLESFEKSLDELMAVTCQVAVVRTAMKDAKNDACAEERHVLHRAVERLYSICSDLDCIRMEAKRTGLEAGSAVPADAVLQ
jgi:phosphatidylinositol kinase/protein kinase (PI-3  family)